MCRTGAAGPDRHNRHLSTVSQLWALTLPSLLFGSYCVNDYSLIRAGPVLQGLAGTSAASNAASNTGASAAAAVSSAVSSLGQTLGAKVTSVADVRFSKP